MQCDLNKQVGQTFHFRIADNVALFVKCDTLPMLKAESVARLLRLFLASFSLSGTGRHLSKNAPSTLVVVGGSIMCKIEHNKWEEANRMAKMQMMI
ncbi:hypothetical protein T05_9800 [Trichinella murrelli]|uniref:Uncharacterized protein n=1 Tax=Trichinella murrelli TaxID=144512 RepID=A0A0V0U497_9BILA|nr:hypothetical protein T05_9800 [Trichinella murrelli]